MPATSGFKEKLVHCDVTELNVPEYTDIVPIALKGDSASQVGFAAKVRSKKLSEWMSDLPNDVYMALNGIADATWWLANQHKETSDIGWPESWSKPVVRTKDPQLELGQPSSIKESRDRLMGNNGSENDIETFDQFARKACQSPELAYLTMMAFLYRQTKDPKVLGKFADVRRKVDGYLEAIDKILGSPGAPSTIKCKCGSENIQFYAGYSKANCRDCKAEVL